MTARVPWLVALILAGVLQADIARAQIEGASPGFARFIADLWPAARALGISRETFDTALRGVSVDPNVLAAAMRQPEYAKPVGQYLDNAVSAVRISIGVRKAREWESTLVDIEAKFGVDRWIALSIWGMETGYGGVRPTKDVFRSLATLAYARYRDDLFREELLSALQILQGGHTRRDKMVSSWAGAMGQPQFMPSSYLKYAVDFTRDGRADIWTSVPDTLASIANYLRENGWEPGRAWGSQVLVPASFNYRRSRASSEEWQHLGLLRADGAPLGGSGEHILFFPSGHRGPAFLVAANYAAIKRYNISDAYALAVAHLADRLRGAAPLRGPWPDDAPLSRDERIALQKLLAKRGYKVNNFQGQIDFDLRDNIRDVQVQFGMLPDGHPTAELMIELRSAAMR